MGIYQSWPPDGEAEAQEPQRGTPSQWEKAAFQSKHQNSEVPGKERRETDVILKGEKKELEMCKTLGPQLGCAAKPTEYDHRKSLIEGDIWTEIMNIDREDSEVSDILSPLAFT